MHTSPSVLHYDTGERGPRMVEGACFTIEPMVCLGSAEIRHDPDGWTVWTADGSLTAQFEHTILMTEEGPEVLTQTKDGPRKGHRFV